MIAQPPQERNYLYCERQLGQELPTDYIAFLRRCNGAEGWIGSESYVMLFPVNQLIYFNGAYEVQRYAPGFLISGSSGGGEAYGFDMRSGHEWPVVQIPFVGMSWEPSQPMGTSFTSFLRNLGEHQ